MTDASAETRLMLLLLIAHGEWYGFEARSKDFFVDNRLQLTNSQINRGCSYLVDEGYLWEVKSVAKCQKTNRRKSESLYTPTPAALQLWELTKNSMLWLEDVLFVLGNLGYPISSYKSPIGKTTDTLLVFVALSANANDARFVVSCGNQRIAEMLGLSEIKVRRALAHLAKCQLISVVAKGLGDTIIFGQRAPIYWIQPICPNKKTIHVGVHVTTYLIPFRFIENLYQFYKTMKKRPSENRFKYSKQESGLSDEMYFELAKSITPTKIAIWLHHVCLSTVFSNVPWYAGVLRSIDLLESNEKTANPFDPRDVLKHKVYDILESALYSGNFKLHEYCPQACQSSLNELTQIRQHIICSLSQELSSVIYGLAKQWRVLADELDIPSARLIDFQRRGQMLVFPDKSPKFESSVSMEHPTNVANHLEDWLISCVLTAYVPNDKKYNHCAVIGDEVWMVGPSKPEKSVRSIKRLICFESDKVIIDETAPP